MEDPREGGPRLIDSCSFTWVFDEERLRFRRLPRGAPVDIAVASDTWLPYDRIEVDASRSTFAVVMDPEGALVFRCLLHQDPCPRWHSAPGSTWDPDQLRLVHAGATATFSLRSESDVVVIEASGHVDAQQAGRVLYMALSLVAMGYPVAIDLDRVDSLPVEAADVLLRGGSIPSPDKAITLRTTSDPARSAVALADRVSRGRPRSAHGCT